MTLVNTEAIELSLNRIADALKAGDGVAVDETGGHVASVTEALMGTTNALVAIARAIERLADVIEDRP